tara:strand:+ start:8260 stop:8736 length:477 start_codon:yes stop_codon:yes gene_type:complete
MSYVLGQIVNNQIYTKNGFQPLPSIGQPTGGIGGLFDPGQQNMGFNPRMLDPLTESISRFYGQQKMEPFREELIGLISQTFPEYSKGGGFVGSLGNMGNPIQPYGGATPLGANIDGIANNNPFGNPYEGGITGFKNMDSNVASIGSFMQNQLNSIFGS